MLYKKSQVKIIYQLITQNLELRFFYMDQVDPFRVVHKLWHWPNAAHSFISRLTNKRPAFGP